MQILCLQRKRGILTINFYIIAGLDDTTADGLNGFATLQKIAGSLGNKAIVNKLEEAKRYLKMDYQSHISKDSSVGTHSASFALSDPKNPALQDMTTTSNNVCHQCLDLCICLDEMNSMGEYDNKESAYDIKIANNQVKGLR